MNLEAQRRAIQAVIDSKQDQIKALKEEHPEPFKESPDAEELHIPELEPEETQHNEPKKEKKRKKE